MRGDFRHEAERFRDIDRAVMKQIENEVEAEAEMQRRAKCFPELVTALRDLLEQVESLDDYRLTRDLEPYKAEACWEAALENARGAIEHSTQPSTKTV